MAKNTPQIATSMKNRPSNLPGPMVMSLSSVAIRISPLRLSGWLRRRSDARRLRSHQFLQTGQEVYRDWEDDGRILFNPDFCQSLQVSQLNAGGLARKQVRRIRQTLRCSVFALGMNNLRPLLALCFRLLRHSARHGLGQINL